jgi:hypothetical protein
MNAHGAPPMELWYHTLVTVSFHRRQVAAKEDDIVMLSATRRFKRITAVILLSGLIAPAGGCFFTQAAVAPIIPRVPEGKKSLDVKQPAKAHLDDGSVVLFDRGFTVQDGLLLGTGVQYDLARTHQTMIDAVPVGRIMALESYQYEVRLAETIGGIAGIAVGTPAAIVGTLVLAIAIFGSCPTVYSPLPGGELLEAELFSHSIVRRFEGTDLDRLEAARPVDGMIRLRIANEALETHYINRLELLAADHPDGFEAFPTPKDTVALLGAPTPLKDARNRTGREVGAAISRRDDSWYQTGPDLDAEATQRPTDDWIDGTVEVPRGAATMTVAFRLRNTLLDTVLLYDVLLRSQGFGALAWLDRFNRNPFAAWRWHTWFEDRFALRVLLEQEGEFREVARVPVTGPIAWHQVAVTFPAPGGPTAKLRFESLADNWQVDWVGVSLEQAPRPVVTAIPVASFTGPHGTDLPAVLPSLQRADDQYLMTSPGESFTLSFPAGVPPPGAQRTWLLKSRGYYIEWLRGEWLTASAGKTDTAPGPGDQVVVEASRRWAEKREQFERDFFSTRIGEGGRR